MSKEQGKSHMTAYVVQAEGEFGAFVGPQFFNAEHKDAAEKWMAEANAALKPGVPQFKIGTVTW